MLALERGPGDVLHYLAIPPAVGRSRLLEGLVCGSQVSGVGGSVPPRTPARGDQPAHEEQEQQCREGDQDDL
jgi:hypothetical protein